MDVSAETSFIDVHFEGIVALLSIIIGGLSGAVALFWRRFVKVDLMEADHRNLKKDFYEEIKESKKAHKDINDEQKAMHRDIRKLSEKISHMEGVLEGLKNDLQTRQTGQ